MRDESKQAKVYNDLLMLDADNKASQTTNDITDHDITGHLPPMERAGENLPPLPVAECLVRQVQWREELRGGFSASRQGIFVK
jgi:hypothetical protein